MRTFRFSVTNCLTGAFLVGATWTAAGLETAQQVAMAPVTPRTGTISSSLAVPARMAGAPSWGRVSVANVNVRWGPGAQHGIVTVLRGGDYVRVQSTVDGWHRIEWPQAAPAWVADALVHPDGRVSGSRVRVRAGGTTSAPILCELNKNDRVEILETVGNWLKIKAPATASAYISAKCVLLGVDPPVPASVASRENPGNAVEATRASEPAVTEAKNPVPDTARRVETAPAKPVVEAARPASTPERKPVVAETPVVAAPVTVTAPPVPAAVTETSVKAAPAKAEPVEPVKIMAPVKITPTASPVTVVAAPVPAAEPAKPERVNHAPSITVVKAGPQEETAPAEPIPVVPSSAAQADPAPEVRPSDSGPVWDDDLEDEDPDLKVHTPDQAELKASKEHEALQALVDEVPTAALVKPTPDQPHFVVVSVDVRAAADQNEFGELLPPPRFVRERAGSREVGIAPATNLLSAPSGLRASAPLVFRLPGQTDASTEFIFLNGKLLAGENGSTGVRHRLLAGDKTLFVRADAAMVNLDTYKDRQVELLARCSPGGTELIVSALHPLD